MHDVVHLPRRSGDIGLIGLAVMVGAYIATLTTRPLSSRFAGPKPHPQYERQGLHRRCLQPYDEQGRRLPREREGRRDERPRCAIGHARGRIPKRDPGQPEPHDERCCCCVVVCLSACWCTAGCDSDTRHIPAMRYESEGTLRDSSSRFVWTWTSGRPDIF